MAKWLLFVHRMPREPSAPRVAVWRALKRIEGGAYVADGVFAVRESDAARAELERLATSARAGGGEGTVLQASPLEDEAALVRLMEPSRAKMGARKPAVKPQRTSTR